MAHKIAGTLLAGVGAFVTLAVAFAPFAGLGLWIVGYHEAARWAWAVCAVGVGMFATAVLAEMGKKPKPGG